MGVEVTCVLAVMLVVRERDEDVGNTENEPVQSAVSVSERDVTGWHAAEPSFAMGNGMNKVSPHLLNQLIFILIKIAV